MDSKPIKAFLLPYAGATVTTYSAFKKSVPENVELVFLEMPGRGSKSNQKPYTDFPSVVNHLLAEIASQIQDQSYILYGHSMGSLLAYELYYQIRKEQLKLPEKLLLSGRIPPELCIHMKKCSEYPDDDFLCEVSAYGGLPDEVIHNTMLRNYFLPILRADFKLIENYIYHERQEKILCDLIVMYGENDPSTPAEDMQKWRLKSNHKFTCIEFPGNHFFCMNEKNQPIITSCMK